MRHWEAALLKICKSAHLKPDPINVDTQLDGFQILSDVDILLYCSIRVAMRLRRCSRLLATKSNKWKPQKYGIGQSSLVQDFIYLATMSLCCRLSPSLILWCPSRSRPLRKIQMDKTGCWYTAERIDMRKVVKFPSSQHFHKVLN